MAITKELKQRLRKSIVINNEYATYIRQNQQTFKQQYSSISKKSKAEACILLLDKDIKQLFGIQAVNEEEFVSPVFKNTKEIRLIAFSSQEKQQIENEYANYNKEWEKKNGFGQYICCYSRIDEHNTIKCKIRDNKYILTLSDEIIELNLIDLYELVFNVSYSTALRELCKLYNIKVHFFSDQELICTTNVKVLNNQECIEQRYPYLWQLILKGHLNKLEAIHKIYHEKVWNGKGNGIFISQQEIATETKQGRSTMQPILKAFLALDLLKLHHYETKQNETYYYYILDEYSDENMVQIDNKCRAILARIKELKSKNPAEKRKYDLSKLTKDTCVEIFGKEVADEIYA